MQPPPGWYDDGSGRQRWWSGSIWSDHYAPVVAEPQAPYPQSRPTYVRPLKDRGTAYVFAILLSGFGAHQFYLGNVGAGIAYVLLWWGGSALSTVLIGIPIVAGVFIWWIVDLCTLSGQVEAANRRILAAAAA